MRKSILAAAAIGAILGGGCSVAPMQGQINQKVNDADGSIKGGLARVAPPEEVAKSAKNSPIRYSNEIYLAQKSTGIDPRYRLPNIFSREVRMRFDGKVNISDIAEQITRMTGVPVALAPDVFMPIGSFVKGSSAGTGSTNTPRQPTTAMPSIPGGNPQQPQYSLQAINSAAKAASPMVVVPPQGAGAAGMATNYALNQEAEKYVSEMDLNYTGTLVGLLDLVTTRFSLNWEHKGEKIQVYRLVTRTIPVFANPGSSTFNSALTKSGGASGGAGGNFTSTSNVTMESDFSVWESVESTIKTMLSRVGKYSISQATGTITVTDAKNIVDMIEDHIRQENAIMSKQIGLRVEIIGVTLTDKQESGIDWNLVYSRLSNLAPQWTLALASPATMATTIAGSMGIQILAPVTNDNSATQRLSGSNLILRALDQVGRTRIVTTTSAVTLNRQPVPLAITNQTSYLAKTTPAAGSGAGGTAVPGLEPGQVTTGFLLNLLPSISTDNRLFLQFSLDISSLERIQSVGAGSGPTAQQIQTPEVTSTQFLQRVAMRPGQTLVLSGFERELGQYDKRNLAKEAPDLMGVFNGSTKREAMVMLVTPVVLGE